MPLEPIFGYFCGKCGWSLPTVQPMEAEAIRIDHVMVGFPQGEPRVQVMLSWKDGPLAEMGEDLWTSVESGASPVFIGRDMPSAALARLGANDVWWYAGLFWSTKELDLSPHVVTLAAAGWSEWEFRQQESLRRRGEEDARIAAAEEMAKEERRKARLAWADAKLSGDSARRQPIPRAVRYDVFKRDNGRCVECGSTFDLQFDHIIPVAMGGATWVENLQLLCSDCNLRKGANLG